LNAGDLKFDKSCPRSGKSADYCIGIRDRLLKYFPALWLVTYEVEYWL